MDRCIDPSFGSIALRLLIDGRCDFATRRRDTDTHSLPLSFLTVSVFVDARGQSQWCSKKSWYRGRCYWLFSRRATLTVKRAANRGDMDAYPTIANVSCRVLCVVMAVGIGASYGYYSHQP